jgi:uncharacterized protein (TIGR02594 family)
MKWPLVFLLLLFGGCSKNPETADPVIPEIKRELPVKKFSTEHRRVEPVEADLRSAIAVASTYMGFHERRHRRELQEFMGVDPVRIDWCAAFVNSVLAELDIPGSESVSEWPLTARSFLRWGQRVTTPEVGDIVIFPRGRELWQGHVGFYYGSEIRNGRRHYLILGGNQSNAVTIEAFPAWRAISIRRYRKN